MNRSRIYSLVLALGLVIGSCKKANISESLKEFTDQVVFKNKGAVSKDMTFGRVKKRGFYVETDELYRYLDGPDYLFEFRDTLEIDPPSGLRSSVPLGGFGAGSVELRADGCFMDWNIFNNSPATGNTKVQLKDAFLGLRVQEKDKDAYATLLRTHPPKNLPSIDKIEYSGSFPVSRLTFSDPKLAIEAKLYAYSEYKIRNPEKSATPCALFSLELHNPTGASVETSFLFNLPNHIKGNFKVDNGLMFTKEGKESASGDITLAARGADDVTYAVGNDLTALWKQFEQDGYFKKVEETTGKYGAISARSNLKPGETRTVTIALGWYFPERPISVEVVGNYYTNLFDNSSDVVHKALDQLPDTWNNILEWNKLCFDNTLPEWLQDAMVNSTATIVKTGIWTKDNRFRQWESFSCPNIDPIHISFARTLPYDLFFPQLKKSIISAHGAAQRENGYIPEKLWPRSSQDVLDRPSPGRILGDCSTAFILSVYTSHKWDGDKAFVDKMWPHVRGAIQWQIDRSQRLGLPDRLAATYDLSGFGKKDLVSYNAFMHMAALKATIELAKAYGEDDLVSLCEENLAKAKTTLKERLWTGEYFRNWWSEDEPANDDLHIDTQFGQVWSYLLGLGETMDAELLKSHLASELAEADSPYGLQVLANADQDRDETGSDVNNTVWQAGSIHWSILNLYLGIAPEQSLHQAKKVINHWRNGLNDQWDYADLTTVSDGYPHTNSHYGRQLMFWGIPLALIGQQYSATEGILAFNPRLEIPYKLPFFTPQGNGTLEGREGEPLLLTLTSGELKLNIVMVDGQVLAKSVSLKAGDNIVLDQG